MNKFIREIVLLTIICLSFICCSKNNNFEKNEIKVALILDSGDINDMSFNQEIYQGIRDFCFDKNISYKYFKPLIDNYESRTLSINLAIAEGYNVIFMSGFLFADSVAFLANDYPDIKFIGIDVSQADWEAAIKKTNIKDNSLFKNIFFTSYKDEISGFFAGYAAVKEGFRHLGYVGGIAVPSVIRYGYGYAQGINQAAIELGVTKDITLEYIYAGQFISDPAITAAMESWYSQRKVEVIFSCGGSIVFSVAEAAGKIHGKVIGVDVDQSFIINKHGDNLCLTSALKGIGETVEYVMQKIIDDKWSDIGGNFQSFGIVSGTEPTSNFVQLPIDTWSMKNFTVEDYKKLVSDIYNGTYKVNDDFEKLTEMQYKVNFYPNIK